MFRTVPVLPPPKAVTGNASDETPREATFGPRLSPSKDAFSFSLTSFWPSTGCISRPRDTRRLPRAWRRRWRRIELCVSGFDYEICLLPNSKLKSPCDAFLYSKYIDKSYRIYYHICKRGGAMEIRLKKQSQKYLDSVDEPTRKKLYKALDQLAQLKGDIRPLKGTQNHYRFKIQHYRILFGGEI